ncbi:MAG: DsbA family protein [Anaerolineae bacterium]|nr:DsbA family protein [Anaerolineae bacterium]
MEPKVRFAFIGQNTISVWLLVLLFIQVILSALVIKRLNDLDQNIANLTITSQVSAVSNQPESPAYVENVSIDDDPYLGTLGAPITIVEFSDYECPFCANIVPEIEAVLNEYDGQIQFVYRDFPLENIHPNSFKAAEAANCAGEQGKYWQMHTLLFANQSALSIESLKTYAIELELDTEKFNLCLDTGKYADEIRHDASDALAYQVNSTPTFFVNGYRVVGASPELLRQAIEDALGKEAG